MRSRGATALLTVVVAACAACAAEWPVGVAGFAAPGAGEHPRLFFRRAELDEVRKRAETPEGRAIIARLKLLLDGGNGTTVPPVFQADADDGDEEPPAVGTPGKYYTLWHGAGYGMLYQLSGDRRYAELGRVCVETAMKVRQTDVDARYSFSKATGALRNGPALGAVAMAYDLCYDGWDADFRDKVRAAIEWYDPSKELGPAKPGNCTLDELARGSKHGPLSNHWGPQLGGAALALLAVSHDPGVDQARVDRLLGENKAAIIRQLSEGQGDHGYYEQHVGAGQITSDTAFVPGLQAWRVAGGVDFMGERPEAEWLTTRWAMWLLPTPRGPEYPNPVRKNPYGGESFVRGGLSRAGQFAQGFGLVPREALPALVWTYERCISGTEGEGGGPEVRGPSGTTDGGPAGGSSFDTVSVYPHRAVLALINWPLGVAGRNPGEYLPRQVSDERMQYHFWRNRWQDGDDILVGALLGADDSGYFGDALRLRVWGLGRRFSAAFPRPVAGAKVVRHEEGLWSLAWPGAGVVVDFREGDGLDAVVVARGLEVGADFPVREPGPLPAGFQATGTWLDAGRAKYVCVREGKELKLYDDVRREYEIRGRSITLTMGDVVRTGTVAADFRTINWGKGEVWTRVARAETLAMPPDMGDEPVMDLTPPPSSIAGEWRTTLKDFPVLRLEPRDGVVALRAQALGTLTVRGSVITATLTPPGATRAATMAGTISASGNLIEWGGRSEWRREGTEAVAPSPWGGGDDAKSRLTKAGDGDAKVSVITFSAAGRHPEVTVAGGVVRVGKREYGMAEMRAVQTGRDGR